MDEKGINVDLSGFSVLSTLNDLEGIYIRQKFLVIEALTGCQTPNVYNVFAGNEKGHQVGNKPIFQCREKSECLQRIFLLANCRAFEINVKQDDSHDQVVLKFDRDCRCTCLCFNRPHMDVKLISKSRQENIGRIVCPFYWCDKGVHVHGQGDELRYKIIAGCCQLGNWCFCSCQACQTIQFDVYDASHQKVGELWKRSAGCIKQCLDSTDNFEIQFPPNATGSDKALLMASAIFIDYMYFEINKDQPEAHHHKH
ncbi:hypothetical protein pb186bvf_011302 [Paramecium bursaria]